MRLGLYQYLLTPDADTRPPLASISLSSQIFLDSAVESLPATFRRGMGFEMNVITQRRSWFGRFLLGFHDDTPAEAEINVGVKGCVVHHQFFIANRTCLITWAARFAVSAWSDNVGHNVCC